MIENFEKRIEQAEQGREMFEQMFDIQKLSLDDTFLLVMTDNNECIRYGIQYLPNFIDEYKRKNVYVLLEDLQYAEAFAKSGGLIKYCKPTELKVLSEYLSIFKEYQSLRIIFLTEKDGYGLFVEELIRKKEFSIEEYVAISLYQLKALEQGV